MGRLVYMLNMSISGIKNIEKEISIDFYGKKVDKKFDPDKNRIKAIYGENGSGKTAIISAVDIVKNFVIDENYLRDNKSRTLLAELVNKKTRRLVFRCEFVTLVEIIYIYEYEVVLSLDENEEVNVSYESLKYRKNNSKNSQTVAFVSKNGEFTELNIEEGIKGVIIDKTKNLLQKQSALYMIFSLIAQNNKVIKGGMVFIYAEIFFLLVHTYFDKEDRHITYYQRKRLNELKQNQLPSESIIDEVSQSIPTNEKRVRVEDYEKYLKKIEGLERFIRLFKPKLNKIDIDKTDDKEFYVCKMIMNYGTYTVDKEFESTGIKHLIDMYDALKLASIGAVVFIDEMDANINDILLNKIIEYFKLYSDGQLIFTAHNTDPMIVVKDNSKSIDFLTNDNKIVSWVKNGHYSPDNCYRNGMIESMPFNIDASDFISAFGEEK